MPKPEESNTNTESIALRAFALLECIVESTSPMSLDELTLALQLPKPTVYRIVHLLMDAALVRRDVDGKRYTIGSRLTSFAVNLLRSDALRIQWHRALQKAVDEIGESCNLTQLDNNQVLYIDRVETSHPLRLHLEVGTRVPLHCTASGKLFLSTLTDEAAQTVLGPEPYERFTAKTITTFGPLVKELAKIRKSGVATHDSERFDDSVAIAVPVLASDGSIVMAVAMHAPASRANLKSCMEYAEALQRAAATIGGTLSSSARHPSASSGKATRKTAVKRKVKP